jgi:hypothetical protein
LSKENEDGKDNDIDVFFVEEDDDNDNGLYYICDIREIKIPEVSAANQINKSKKIKRKFKFKKYNDCILKPHTWISFSIQGESKTKSLDVSQNDTSDVKHLDLTDSKSSYQARQIKLPDKSNTLPENKKEKRNNCCAAYEARTSNCLIY